MAAGLIALAPSSITAQAPAKKPRAAPVAKKAWLPARTKWGDPDIRGIWKGFESVPLERPLELGDKQFYTDAEIADKVAKAQAAVAKRNALVAAGKLENKGTNPHDLTAFNDIFDYSESAEPPHISRRTSAIVDPSTGRFPPWTLDQVKYWEAREAATKGRGQTDSPDDMNLATRCINVVGEALVDNWGLTPDMGERASPGPVRRIIQSRGSVTFVMGDKPVYRIVPLDGHPHISADLRQWMGDARGHWEGNSLVVDITNITFGGSLVIPNNDDDLYPGSAETLHVIERFTPIDPDTLEYRYTIDDPSVYVQPYTVLQFLRRSDDDAGQTTVCQEDPKDFANSFANARADEQESVQNRIDFGVGRPALFENLKKQAIAAASGQSVPSASTVLK